MRVFFHPANFGVAANAAGIKMKASLPLRSFDTINDMRDELVATTDNVGNIVHNEAVAKSFEINRLRSCTAPMYHYYLNECKRDKAVYQSRLKAEFDAVVFSLANMVAVPAPGAEVAQQKHMELLCEIIEAIPVPFYMFGLGLQDPVDDIDKLTPSMLDFLKLLNDKAVLFGVRGSDTLAFMHKHGFTNAVALGCPSLYVYPDNMLSIKKPDVRKGADVLTAGHLWLRNIFGYQPERLDFLRELADTFNASYAFQNDFYSYHELAGVRGFYDDASGVVDKEIFDNYLTAHNFDPIAFDSYWHFRDARAWRTLAEKTDFYVGDRFHGGVVSLQVGKPALFMFNDLRVEEMTCHIGAPRCSFADLKDRNLLDVVEEAFSDEKLEEFKDTYSMRVREYFDTCAAAGMKPLQALKTRAARRKGLQHAWQRDLLNAVGGDNAINQLPTRSAAALKVVLCDQQSHHVGELLIRALVADELHKELDAVTTVLAQLDADKTNENWAVSHYLFRLAYFLTEHQRFGDAHKFADIYYNKIYARKGDKTELYVTIQIERGEYDAAEAAVERRADDEGYEARFAVLYAKIAVLKQDSEAATKRIVAARSLDVNGAHEDAILMIETLLS